MDIVSLIVTLLVITISLIIVSYIPLIGVQIDSFGKALISGIVFGVLNVIGNLLTPSIPLTLGLVSFIINVVVFGLSAKLVEGFRLKYGIWSAVLGAFFMSLVLGLVTQILGPILPG
ncbi:MAG: phage holin family protein [Elainellaceae cyanobacterium]